jgi:protein-tyrosine kinase
MSKIYEALRRHDGDGLRRHDAEALRNFDPEPTPRRRHDGGSTGNGLVDHSEVRSNRSFAPNREMQALFRSVETLAPRESGTMILFSSAQPREGRTTICGSFASTLAHNFGKSVLILDADRERTLTQLWGGDAITAPVAKGVGLEQSAEISLPTARSAGAHGSISVTPIESLAGSDGMYGPDPAVLASIKGKLAARFDYILIDAPSLADAVWSPAVGAIADGVILVVQAERTRWPVALNSKSEFEGSGAKILGVFLNRRRFYIPPRIYRRI